MVYPTTQTEVASDETPPAEAATIGGGPTNETILIEFSQSFNAGTAGDTASYLFDIDVGGEHFPGSGGTIDIDCTNATGDGSGSISGNLRGNWRTDGREFFLISQPTTASDIATELFVEADTSLRSDVTVTRGTGIGNSFTEDTDGLVVRISSSDEGFSFFMSTSTTHEVFTWDSDWGVLPTIYVDGVEYPTVDTSSSFLGTPPTTGGSINPVQGSFPASATTGQLAAQHLHDQIEATYAGVTVSDPIETPGTGGTIDIDFSSASGSGSIFQILHGSIATDSSFLSSASGSSPNDLAFSFFQGIDSIGSILRSDIEHQIGTGVGTNFVESASPSDGTGTVVRLTSATNGFSFWLTTSSSHTNFTWDPDWDTIPIIYVDGVEYPTTDTIVNADGTPPANAGVLAVSQITVDTGVAATFAASLSVTENSGDFVQPTMFDVSPGSTGGLATIEIDFTDATVSSITAQTLRGNWLSSTTSVAFGTLDNAVEHAEVLEGVMRPAAPTSGVLIERDGAVVTLIQDEALTFWMVTSADFSSTNFLWDPDWTQPPEIRVNGVVYPTVNTEDDSAATPGAEAQPVGGGGGTPVVTQINQNVPTSGPISTADFYGATNGES